jgi:hypothetical protein
MKVLLGAFFIIVIALESIVILNIDSVRDYSWRHPSPTFLTKDDTSK